MLFYQALIVALAALAGPTLGARTVTVTTIAGGAVSVGETFDGDGTNTRNSDGVGPWDGTGTAAGFSSVSKGFAIDPAGGFFVADKGNAVVRHVDPDTAEVNRVAGGFKNMGSASGDALTTAQLLGPSDVAVDLARTTMWIVDQYAQNIKALAFDTNDVTVLAGPAVPTDEAGADGIGTQATFYYLNQAAFEEVRLLLLLLLLLLLRLLQRLTGPLRAVFEIVVGA